MNSGAFNSRLESLRGLAALVVAASHCFIFNGAPWQTAATEFLLNFLNGAGAVVLFFVLSGHVLGLGIRRMAAPAGGDWWKFALRRVMRIVPAFWVFSLLLVVVLGHLAGWPTFAASDWMNQHPHAPLSARYVVENLLMLDSTLNPVTWTLKVEIVCSLGLPLVHWISTRLSSVGRGVLLLGLIIGPKLLLPDGTAVRFLFLFYMGYLLPAAGPGIAWATRQPLGRVALWSVALATLFFGYHTAAWTVVQGTGAALLIALVMFGPETRFARMLDWSWVRFYGRISYSFYLIHMKAMVVLGLGMLATVPAPILTESPLLFGGLLLAASIAVATPLAWCLYHGVEKPFIEFSKRLCSGTRLNSTATAPLNGSTHPAT